MRMWQWWKLVAKLLPHFHSSPLEEIILSSRPQPRSFWDSDTDEALSSIVLRLVPAMRDCQETARTLASIDSSLKMFPALRKFELAGCDPLTAEHIAKCERMFPTLHSRGILKLREMGPEKVCC